MASDSRARKKILALAGLKFKVLNSRVKEKRVAGSLSYASLVKRNALAKAKDVARKVRKTYIRQAQKFKRSQGDVKEIDAKTPMGLYRYSRS